MDIKIQKGASEKGPIVDEQHFQLLLMNVQNIHQCFGVATLVDIGRFLVSAKEYKLQVALFLLLRNFLFQIIAILDNSDCLLYFSLCLVEVELGLFYFFHGLLAISFLVEFLNELSL